MDDQATNQPTYEELLAERDRLLNQQRQLLLDRRFILLAADILLDPQATERERSLAGYLVRLLRRNEQRTNGQS